ncbi:carbonyl reductase (NADPH) [Galdieria sulphuraria]|uniref:Carbonyl reductase (NADPH) n=1 Tax=Galdieria sulphuraria TaxID=130081 RepID=M2W641_GALSU|nr:carbonyl reductase (NADPH) [Galdieria sulphuraria]EME31231.1 carbonyl reductase (NADPH) [Galdieria sulphuraria]|eukprot:XP_005707751.1 carbonyl reductase (NADPH) [Galdieria sulphuraria]
MSTDSPRVAVVTGANKGIGYAIVRQLADPNLSLTVVLTSRDEERGKQAVAALAAEGLDVLFHQLDITKEPSISAFANWLKDRFQGLDILVNNAGMAYRGDAFGYEVAKDTVDCNYFGTLHVIEKLSPLLREGARVVNVSSRAGKFSRLSPQLRNAMFRRDLTIPELSAMMNDFIQSVKEGTWEQKGWPKQTYAVSKMGVTIMTRILAREEKRPNILYNACCPGYVRTDMTNPSAPLSPEQGAKTPVYLALLPEGGVSGGFFADGRQWNIMEEL